MTGDDCPLKGLQTQEEQNPHWEQLLAAGITQRFPPEIPLTEVRRSKPLASGAGTSKQPIHHQGCKSSRGQQAATVHFKLQNYFQVAEVIALVLQELQIQNFMLYALMAKSMESDSHGSLLT